MVVTQTPRIGIRYRVGMLGALGIVGLVLVGCLYSYGLREQTAMEREANAAAAASLSMSRILNTLTETHLFAAQFSLGGSDVQAGQEVMTLASIDRTIAEINALSGLSNATQAGAALIAKAVAAYGLRFSNVVELKSFQGFSDQDGLAAQLTASGNAAEAEADQSWTGELQLRLVQLRGVQLAFSSSRDPNDADRFNTNLVDILSVIEHSSQDEPRKHELAAKLNRYDADFLEYVEQSRLIGQARHALDEAYEDARVAAEAARGLAITNADDWRATITAFQQRTARWMLCALGAAIGIVVVLAFTLGRSIAKPLERVAAATGRLVRGDDQVEISDVRRGDEVGDVARALAVFRELTIEFRSLTEQRDRRRNEEEVLRHDAVHVLASQIEDAIGSVIGSLADAADRMKAGAVAVVTTIGHTRRRAGEVATSSHHCSAGVKSVAAATEQLVTTLDEVSRQIKQSAESVGRASAQVRVSGQIVHTLAAKAMTIENVLALIANIAARTNLLALNASIEAARSGAAGRGFAVVAAEIKALSHQTGKATETIRSQMADMQIATTRAVDAIGAISAEFAGMDQVAAAVAAAVEQQQEATSEIARSAQQVASGVERVSDAATGLHSDAEHADGIAGASRQASADVAVIAEALSGNLGHFLSDLRARA